MKQAVRLIFFSVFLQLLLSVAGMAQPGQLPTRRFVEFTVATLPTASTVTAQTFLATDAKTPGQCTTGGGSLKQLCRSNGTSYDPVGTPGDGRFIIDGIRYPLTDAGLTSCLTDAGANGTCYVPADVNINVTGDHVLNFAWLTLRCERGATLTYTAAGRISLQGTGATIDGCTFVGPGVGTTGALQTVTMQGDRQRFINNVVHDFGQDSGSGIIEPFAGSYGEISGNLMYNNADNDGDIFINNTTTATTMDGWRIHDNLVGSIIAHTTSGTAQISNISIENNIVRPGENSRTEYGIEVGAFGGSTPFGLILSGNQVYLQASGTAGGISLSTINPPCSETGDTFNAQGFTYTISSFEHVLLNHCSISNLSANEGTGGNGLTCDRCNHTAFSNIAINGFTTASSGYGFHTLVSSTVGPSASDNVFSNITVTAPATFAGNAFWEQCNATGATCTNNSYNNLHVVGTSGTTGNGFTLENDVGTMTNTTINNSQFENLSVGINQIGTRSNVKLIENQFASTSTLYGGTVTGSFIVDPGGAFSNLFNLWQGNWASLSLGSLSTNRTFTFPDAAGTFALKDIAQAWALKQTWATPSGTVTGSFNMPSGSGNTAAAGDGWRDANGFNWLDNTGVNGGIRFWDQASHNRLDDTTGTITAFTVHHPAAAPTTGSVEATDTCGSAICTESWIHAARVCFLIADHSGSSSATLGTITWSNSCTFPVAASTVYTVSCDVQSTGTNASGGLFMGWTGPASPVASNYTLSQATSATATGYHNISTTTTYSTAGAGVVGQTITTVWPAHFAGTFENGTTAGTLSIQFANGSATGSTVLKRGSFCTVN